MPEGLRCSPSHTVGRLYNLAGKDENGYEL